MDWGNAFMHSKKLDADGFVESIEADLHLEGDFKKTSKKIHWLASATSAPLIDVNLIDYDYLITKKKIEDADDWTDYINPTTEFRTLAVADNNVKDLKQGDIIQFERKGYYIVDRAFDSTSNSLDLIFIPDGKASTVALKMPVDALSKPKSAKPTLKEAQAKLNMYEMDKMVSDFQASDLSNINMYAVPSVGLTDSP
jgi:glutamyl-tRNA synthetase